MSLDVLAEKIESQPGEYRLMSTIGVPSIMSSLSSFTTRPSTPSTRAEVSPIGFGLPGDLTPNTPLPRPPCLERVRPDLSALWNQPKMIRCVFDSMPASPASYSGKTSMDAGTPSMGISSPSPTDETTLPIGVTLYGPPVSLVMLLLPLPVNPVDSATAVVRDQQRTIRGLRHVQRPIHA